MVELYIQYGHHAATVLRELGYPNSAQSLVNWYREFEQSGTLHGNYQTALKYTQEQRAVAVKHYIEHGKCLSYTCREPGYPSHTLLKEWVLEAAPEHADSRCKTGSPMVKLNQQQKDQAVVELCSHTAAAQDIANRYGVAKSTVYKWKRQLVRQNTRLGLKHQGILYSASIYIHWRKYYDKSFCKNKREL